MPAYAALAVLGYAAAGWTIATIEVIKSPLHIAYLHVYLGEGAAFPADGATRSEPCLHSSPTSSACWQITAALGDSVWSRERALLGREPTMWSTYASYIEYRHNYFHPSFDYIIHALGHDNRELYARTFLETKPDIVQTLEPTYTGYEEWLALHHWNFYRPLLRDYEITAAGPWSYFWTRAAKPFDEKPTVIIHSAVPPGVLAVALDGSSVPRDSLGFYEVRLFYHVKNPWKKVPVLGTLPRYIVHVAGASNRIPVSLAPYETEKRFPVIAVGANKVIRLAGQVYSIVPGATLTFDSLHFERLRLSPANYRWARDFITGPPVFNPDTTRFGSADSTREATRRR